MSPSKYYYNCGPCIGKTQLLLKISWCSLPGHPAPFHHRAALEPLPSQKHSPCLKALACSCAALGPILQLGLAPLLLGPNTASLGLFSPLAQPLQPLTTGAAMALHTFMLNTFNTDHRGCEQVAWHLKI